MSAILMFVALYNLVSYYLNLSVHIRFNFIECTPESEKRYEHNKRMLTLLDITFYTCIGTLLIVDTIFDFTDRSFESFDQIVNDSLFLFLAVIVFFIIQRFKIILTRLEIRASRLQGWFLWLQFISFLLIILLISIQYLLNR